MIRHEQHKTANGSNSPADIGQTTSREQWRYSVQRSVPLHPDPLPQGEGIARTAQWKALWSGLYSAERMVHPLPKGEGRGEGKGSELPSRVPDHDRRLSALLVL